MLVGNGLNFGGWRGKEVGSRCCAVMQNRSRRVWRGFSCAEYPLLSQRLSEWLHRAFRLFTIFWTFEHEWPCCRNVFSVRMRGQWLSVRRIISLTLCTMQKTISCSTSEGRGHMLYYGNNARRKNKDYLFPRRCVLLHCRRDGKTLHQVVSSGAAAHAPSCQIVDFCCRKNSHLFKCFQIETLWSRISSAVSSILRNAHVCCGEGSSSRK